MGVRYRAEIDSYSGVAWKYDILDSGYSSTVNTFKTIQPQIAYKGITERTDPVLASTLTLPFFIVDSTTEAFINEIMQSQEERFTVMVYRNTVLYWSGVLLPDEVQREDNYYPYTVNLTFTDGISRLKDLEYNNAGAAYTGRETLLAHLLNCLNSTGVSANYAALDLFISTSINWYDIRHTYAINRCPLAYTTLDHAVFVTTDSDGNTTYKTRYEVMEMILTTFNARIMMVNGAYHIVQAQDYSRPAVYYRKFDKAGTIIGYAFTDNRLTQTSTLRKAGAVYKYLKPFKHVTKVYKPRISSNESGSILPVQAYYTPAVNLINIVPAGIPVFINFTLREHFALEDPSGDPVTLYSKWRLNFILTDTSTSAKKYLTNKNGGYQWSTSASDYVTITGPIMQGWDWTVSWDKEIATPNIPSESTGTFELSFIGLYKTNGQAFTLGDNIYSVEHLNYTVIPDITDSQADCSPIEFKATNTLAGGGTVASTSTLECKETLIGDGPSAVHIGRLMTSNGTTYDESTAWGVHNSTSRVNINQLSVNQILTGQRVPVDCIQAGFVNPSISALKALSFDTKIYVPLMITLFMETDEADGEWFNCVIPA